jgi:hypothetical protein
LQLRYINFECPFPSGIKYIFLFIFQIFN